MSDRLTAPSTFDHLLRLDIPIPGKNGEPEKVISIDVPPVNWMAGDEVAKYFEWAQELAQAEAALLKWAQDKSQAEADIAKWEKAPEDERGEKPTIPERPEQCAMLDDFSEKESVLRWLKPYVSAADYRLMLKKLPKGTVDWLEKQLTSAPAGDEISVGESSASTDS